MKNKLLVFSVILLASMACILAPLPTQSKLLAKLSTHEPTQLPTLTTYTVKVLATPRTVTATETYHLRTGPGIEYNSVGIVQSGDVLEIVGIEIAQDGGTWYQIDTGNYVNTGCCE